MKKINPKINKIINRSIEEAKSLNLKEINPEHLMIALINDNDNTAINYLKYLKVDIDDLHKLIELYIKDNLLFGITKNKSNDIPLSELTTNIIKNAEIECNNLYEDVIDTHHILLSILKENTFVTDILHELDVDHFTYKNKIKQTKIMNRFDDETGDDSFENKNKKSQPAKGKSNTPILDNFSTDVTKKAEEGKIDPVIGREDIIQRVAQVLSRRKKNNPVLIGNPGVGKTTIIEGLALMIKNGNAPRTLQDKRIVSLDLASMVAGTKYRGQFEERIKGIMDELKDIDNVILFIDELHTLVGAGNSSGSMDAANIFKPAMARGELQIVGATTLDEYRENIEKDGALTRRFQEIIVEPPSLEDTLNILNKIKGSYEDYHKVKYSEEAIIACVKLADRYITDREFPDKAIDILDEVGSRSQVIIKAPKKISDLEKNIADIKEEKNKVVKSQKYEEAAKLRDNEKQAIDKLEQEKKLWLEELDNNRIVITDDDVSVVVANMTGIPIDRLTEKEGARLMNMETEIGDAVIGQYEAVEKISKSLRRNRVGIRNPKKPLGTFLFLGPTGTGKCICGDETIKVRNKTTNEVVEIEIKNIIGL